MCTGFITNCAFIPVQSILEHTLKKGNTVSTVGKVKLWDLQTTNGILECRSQGSLLIRLAAMLDARNL